MGIPGRTRWLALYPDNGTRAGGGTLLRLLTVFLLWLPLLSHAAVSEAGPGLRPLRLAALLEDEKRPQGSLGGAGKQPEQEKSWAFYIDNDLFVSPHSDRDYTGGFSFTRSGPRAEDHVFSADRVLGGINGLMDIRATDINLYSFEFGVTAFTPEDIAATAPLRNDRPYASLVYVSNTRQHIYPQRRASIISSLTLGVLGLDIANDFQNKIHRQLDAREAKGWDNQISRGGELTFRYSTSHQQVLRSNYNARQFNYELKTSHKASLGYLTDLSWSVSARLGRIRAPWWTFNPQTTEYVEKSAPLVHAGAGKRDEFYVWLGMSFYLRAYNALLQGQVRDSAVRYSYSELNHLIAEAWLGVTRETGAGFRISYFIRGQTSEIRKGAGSRDPVWGGFILSRTY